MSTLLKFLLAGSLVALSFQAMAKDQPKVEFVSIELGDGLYMIEGKGTFTGGNIALSVGGDGVVMIDDSMPPFLDLLKKKVKNLTKRDVDFLINTHAHGDHIGNNEAFAKDGVSIVAHKNMRKHLLKNGIKAKGKNIDAPKGTLPVITFSNTMAFHLNGEEAHIFHMPNAHTDGDAAIHFRKANVIHTGDIFFSGRFPFIDVNSGGSVKGYISAQKKIVEKSDALTKIIPGHGALATRADLIKSVLMLEDVVGLIEPHIKAGKSEDDVVQANPIAKYDALSWGFISTEKMTRQVYRSLSGHKAMKGEYSKGVKKKNTGHDHDGHSH